MCHCYVHQLCGSALALPSAPLKPTDTVTAGYSIPVWGTLKHRQVHPTEHIQHKPTRHHSDDGTRLVLQHPLGALGGRALEHAHPLLLQPVPRTMAICPHFQGEGSLLQRTALGRLLPGQKSQTSGQVSLPRHPSKISRRKK